MGVTGPITGGEHGWAFGGPLLDFAALGYSSEEYFLDGTASRYAPKAGTELDRDGKWDVEPCESAPFNTRFVVYRPLDATKFNGTAIVSWNNVSAGHDLFGGDSRELIEGGYAFVGVTTQRVGVHGIAPMNLGLVDWDKARYGSLSISSDDYSFDIFTQAARVIGPDRPRDGIDPMGGLDVRHLVGLGASQSAGRLGTYVNAIHPLTHAFDGYLLQIYFGAGSPLEVGEFVVNLNDPDMGNEGNRRLRLRGSNLVRDDLDVPVMIVNSELEAIACYPVRQPDTDRLRWWESAGTCHVSEQGQGARSPKYVRDFGAPMAVAPGINRIPMIPLFDASMKQMHEWINGGPPPADPAQDRVRGRSRRDRARRRRHRKGRHPPAAGRGADRHEQRDPPRGRHLRDPRRLVAPVQSRRPHRSVRRSRPVPREVRSRREAGGGEWGPARAGRAGARSTRPRPRGTRWSASASGPAALRSGGAPPTRSTARPRARPRPRGP